MPPTQTPISRAKSTFAEHQGLLRASEARRLGIHPRTLSLLRDTGELEQIGRGLYRLASAPLLTNPDWVTISRKVPTAVICLISALAHHGLTTQVPHTIDIALRSHSQAPKVDGLPIRVFWYSERTYCAGVQLVTIDQVPIRVYSPEKTIADCFKYRNKIGLDLAIEALRTYREETAKINRKAILTFAQICGVQNVMRPYLEAIL